MTYDEELISNGECPELVMRSSEFGPIDGRCLLPIVPGGYACAGHTEEIEAWRAKSDEERAYDEYMLDMYGE